jgi:NADH-quinone oxidoreductase subunit G
MSDDTVKLEVDGVEVVARKGQMLIEVTDAVRAYVPRFCYHSKLSVAANCRMCLVEVEKAPKPLPACATPVGEGMKVFTHSNRAVAAQKATMEFLLINHPLDCPICDQGGECELQDLAMGFGRDVSRYTESKRVVQDKNLGPLVSTDMTRCIHCTRCVRFGQEIAGIQELGTTGRSEHMEIGTYIEKSVDHELSGNIIDLCPVGALNNKPYRFSARAWEMVARPLVSPHDCVGSNLYGHVVRGELKRVVPRDNESVNETWISDRDRFSCEGLACEDRLTVPMIKVDQEWREASWDLALEQAAEAIRSAQGDSPESIGVLMAPTATTEEAHLLARLGHHLGTRNIDHRLRRRDFRDQAADPAWMGLGQEISAYESLDGLLVVGSNLRREVPILAHRIRKGALAGSSVAFVNPGALSFEFPVAAQVCPGAASLHRGLGSVLLAAAQQLKVEIPGHLARLVDGISPGDAEQAAAASLINKDRALLLLGLMAQRHPCFSDIRAAAAALAELTGARLGYLSESGNSVGATLAGVLPHRAAGGMPTDAAGLDATAMLASPRKVYLLFGLEPEADMSAGDLAMQGLQAADSVVACAAYTSPDLLDCADVLLPISTFAETDGTFINGEGRWQSFEAAARPPGEARPGWKVLRVLGNLLGLPDCDYRTTFELRDELAATLGEVSADTAYNGSFSANAEPADVSEAGVDVPMYAVDGIVRRARPLQETAIGQEFADVDRTSNKAVNG